MQSLTLSYRDDDRTPVIFAIREPAKQHYHLDVRIARITDGEEYEAARFKASRSSRARKWRYARMANRTP